MNPSTVPTTKSINNYSYNKNTNATKSDYITIFICLLCCIICFIVATMNSKQ